MGVKRHLLGKPECSSSWLTLQCKTAVHANYTRCLSSCHLALLFFIIIILVPSSGLASSELRSGDWAAEGRSSTSEFKVAVVVSHSFVLSRLRWTWLSLTSKWKHYHDPVTKKIYPDPSWSSRDRQEKKRDQIDLVYSDGGTAHRAADKPTVCHNVKQPRTLFCDQLAPSLPSDLSWGGQGIFYTYCMKTVKLKALILSIV